MLALVTIISSIILHAASVQYEDNFLPSAPDAPQNVHFRETQKLTDASGWQIYFYRSGKCEGYDDKGRLMFSTTYTLRDGEAFLLDEKGNVVYKGQYVMSRDGVNIRNIKIAGTTYYKK